MTVTNANPNLRFMNTSKYQTWARRMIETRKRGCTLGLLCRLNAKRSLLFAGWGRNRGHSTFSAPAAFQKPGARARISRALSGRCTGGAAGARREIRAG